MRLDVRSLGWGLMLMGLLSPLPSWAAEEAACDPILAERVDRQKLEAGIHAAAEYLVRACDEEGRFAYLVNLDPQYTDVEVYNVLRHAGAIYALGAYDQWCPRDDVRAAMKRAAGYMKQHGLGPVGDEGEMLAIWSTPRLSNPGSRRAAKLGGTGLGLVALGEVERFDPGFTSREELQGLGRFVLYMQKPDGNFFSEYSPEKGREASWVSIYYPGETALGLLALARSDEDPRWTGAAQRAVTYLARPRPDTEELPLDHWDLLATAELLRMPGGEPAPEVKTRWLAHAAATCETIFALRIPYSEQTPAGDLSGDGQLCRTATRLEGLLAAREFLPAEYADLNARISRASADAVNFLLECQVKEGPHAGGFTRVAPLDHVELSHDFQGPRRTEIRVDYVQHAMSALLQCAKRMGMQPTERK